MKNIFAITATALSLISITTEAGINHSGMMSRGGLSRSYGGSHVYTTDKFTITHTPATKNNGDITRSTTVVNNQNGHSVERHVDSYKINYSDGSKTIGHSRGIDMEANDKWFHTYRETDIGNIRYPTGTADAKGITHHGEFFYADSITTGYYEIMKDNSETTTLFMTPVKEIKHMGVTPNNPTGGTVVIPLSSD
jgi:hypothetical protein